MNRHFYIRALLLVTISGSISALVGPIVPGRSLWYIYKKLGMTVDIIESKVCLIDSQLDVVESKICALATEAQLLSIGDVLCSQIDSLFMEPHPVMASGLEELEASLCSKLELIDSQLDSIENKVDDAFLCMSMPITGPTTIAQEGTYCVANDIVSTTPIITITSDNVVIDIMQRCIYLLNLL